MNFKLAIIILLQLASLLFIIETIYTYEKIQKVLGTAVTIPSSVGAWAVYEKEFKDGLWHHILVSRGTQETRVYYDGKLARVWVRGHDNEDNVWKALRGEAERLTQVIYYPAALDDEDVEVIYTKKPQDIKFL